MEDRQIDASTLVSYRKADDRPETKKNRRKRDRKKNHRLAPIVKPLAGRQKVKLRKFLKRMEKKNGLLQIKEPT